MLRKLAFPIMVVAVLFWVVGCSESPSDSHLNSQEPNLEEDFGGYTASDENVAFGDDELLETEGDYADYDDPVLQEPRANAIICHPDAGLYHLRAIWGRLEYDSTVTEETDWSGSLTVSRGVEIIRRVIRFEPNQDSILQRTQRNVIEWHSITTVHNDGISVDIFVPPPVPHFDTTFVIDDDGQGNVDTAIVVDTTYPDPVTVAFETEPYSASFTLEQLAGLDSVVQLDDGNAVAFQAFRLHRVRCPRGFLAGKWGFNDENEGIFRGVWMEQHGRIVGYLRGHFGKNDEGEKAFYGKWISRNGQFEGFLKGHYGYRPSPEASDRARLRAGGWFKGQIYNADEIEIGVLKGWYKSAEHPVKARYFQGRWKLHCQDLSVDDDGLEDEEIDYDTGNGQ
jgi:hypothetical protein